MLRGVVSFSLLLGIARSSPWPHRPCTLDTFFLVTPLCFVGTAASTPTVGKSASRQQHRPPIFRRTQQRRASTSTQHHASTIHARQCSSSSSSSRSSRSSRSCRGSPQTTVNPLRQRTCQPEHASSSSSSTSVPMSRRTGLAASPPTNTSTRQHFTSTRTMKSRQYSSTKTISNPLRSGTTHPEHTTTTTSSLSMGRRTELGASPWKTDSRTVQEWLEFSERELRKINKVLGPPRAGRDIGERLGLLADGKTDSVVGFLRVDFRMSKADTRSMMIRFPRLLVMPREIAVDRCDWLVANLNLNKKQLARMVLKCPILFAYGPEVSYAPAVEWFRDYLRMDTREVARLVVRLPQVLGLSPDGNLKKTVRFFESLGLSRSQVCRMVLLHPQLFSYSIEEKMIPMLEWLQMQLRASPDEVIEMITKYPSLMGCSMTKNIAPKLSFLREIMKASVPDIRAAVVACPSLLGYSLERRIRPRVTLMLERGVDPMFADHKWLVTVVPDHKFEEWIQENTGLKR